MQKALSARESKFGKALVVETAEKAGAYMLGFRIDPTSALESCLKELTALQSTSSVSPVFGVEFTVEEKPESLDAVTVPHTADDVEVVSGEDTADAFAAYFADSNKEVDRSITFNADLGLAVELPPEGHTLEKLWSVL